MPLIHHPVLDRTTDVHERTVRIWERSGWQRVAKPKRSRSRSASPKLDEKPAPVVEGAPPTLTKEE